MIYSILTINQEWYVQQNHPSKWRRGKEQRKTKGLYQHYTLYHLQEVLKGVQVEAKDAKQSHSKT